MRGVVLRGPHPSPLPRAGEGASLPPPRRGVNGLAKHRVGGFHPGFGQGGMGVDRVGKVRGRQFRANRHRRFRNDVRSVGADGVRSVVRAKLLQGASDSPEATGRTAWRAVVPAAAPAAPYVPTPH